VVGGGLAGLTLGIAAGRVGAQVTVLESAGELMGLWPRNSQRPIHPNVLRWPFDDLWTLRSAQTPVLGWTEGTLEHILANEWLPQIATEVRKGTLEARTSVENLYFEQVGDTYELQWDEAATTKNASYDEIVFCVGFGREASFGGHDTFGSFSYWDWTADQERFGALSEASQTAIIGAGDGGITDLLNSALSEPLDYSAITSMVHSSDDFVTLRNSAADVEKIVWRNSISGNGTQQLSNNVQLHKRLVNKEICDYLGARLVAKERRPWLIFQGLELSPKTSPFNRLLQINLRELGGYQPVAIQDRLDLKTPAISFQGKAVGYSLDRTWLKPRSFAGDIVCDRIILRIGPTGAIVEDRHDHWDALATAMMEKSRSLRPYLPIASLDRYQMWDRDVFDV